MLQIFYIKLVCRLSRITFHSVPKYITRGGGHVSSNGITFASALFLAKRDISFFLYWGLCFIVFKGIKGHSVWPLLEYTCIVHLWKQRNLNLVIILLYSQSAILTWSGQRSIPPMCVVSLMCSGRPWQPSLVGKLQIFSRRPRLTAEQTGSKQRDKLKC